MKKYRTLPYFDSVQRIVSLSTKDGFDHGWMIIIAHDPMAGHSQRYSVFQINCQTGHTKTYGRELHYNLCRKIQDKLVAKLIKKGYGIYNGVNILRK